MGKRKTRWSVEKVIAQFSQSEGKLEGRGGTFRINLPFEEAMKSILKAKPERKKKIKKV